jgi:hypothetical protein
MSSNLTNLDSGEEVNFAQGVAQGEGQGEQVRLRFMPCRRCFFNFRFNVVPIR